METIWNFITMNLSYIVLIIYTLMIVILVLNNKKLNSKYALQGCELIDAELNYKKYLKGNIELLTENIKLNEEIIALNSGLGKMERDNIRLGERLQDTNIRLINAKGQALYLKMRKKEVSHEGVFIADPANAATIYHDFRGWRVKRHGSIGYIAGWHMETKEIILGFYEYTGNNNIAITDDCIMSRREFVDYNAVTINELRELGFV